MTRASVCLAALVGLAMACGGEDSGGLRIDGMTIEVADGFTYLVVTGAGFGSGQPSVDLERVTDATHWDLPVAEFSDSQIDVVLPEQMTADWYVVGVTTPAGTTEAPLLALAGSDGDDGVDCWDLDGDGEPDLAVEDRNGDEVVDVEDCQGTGAPGLHCWDLDGDGEQDADEDINGDDLWNVLDCRGGDGDDGYTSLILLEDEPAGSNCPYGGKRLSIGIDWNRDGALGVAEIDQVTFFCQGDGSGTDGLSSLVSVSPEPAGDNCVAGGQKIETGLDADRDGVLDPGEVASVAYVCAGELVVVEPEVAGANCADGGVRVSTGIDDDHDGVLDPGEVANVRFVCNGADGSDGHDTLVRLQAESPGANCVNGGSLIQSGLDLNDNGELDAGEATQSEYICNGVGSDGLTSLVQVDDEPAGPNCANGGSVIYSGLDLNDNGLLEAGEIEHTAYVCQGATGPAGADGATSLLRIEDEPPGSHCPEGGSVIYAGLDSDDDGYLDAGEITSTAYVCDGSDGTAYLCDEGEIRYVVCGAGDSGEQRQVCDASHNWINVGDCEYGGGGAGECPDLALGFTQLTASAPTFNCATHSVVVHNGEIWVFAGNLVYHSPDGADWTQEADAPYASNRCYHNAVSWNGQIWIVGGQGTNNEVWSFDPGGAGWQLQVASAPYPQRGLAAALVFQGDLYLMGGENTGYNAINDIWRTSDGVNWTQVAAHAPWSSREAPGASILGSELYIAFGYSADSVWRTPDGDTWYQVVKDLESPLAGRRAPMVTYDGRLWSVGGWSYDAWFSDDGETWCLGNSNLGFQTGAWTSAVVFGGQIILVTNYGEVVAMGV